MNLNDITNAANAYTDENFPTNTVLVFVNEAISKINVELKVDLPFFGITASTQYTALGESWIRALLVPYVCYSIKMNDGSLQEAMRFLGTFDENFFKLVENKYEALGEAYRQEDFDEIYQRDLGLGINIGWFNKYRG